MSVLKYYDTGTSTWVPLAIGETGATGATGPRGLSGTSYVENFTTPSTVWTVNHNLSNKYVNVEPIDSTGNSFVGRYDYPVIHFIDDNSLTLTFTTAQTGHVAISSGGQGATGPMLNYQTTCSNLISLSIPSTVSCTIGLGLPYTPYQNIIFVAVGYTNQYMTGIIQSYNAGTGALVVNFTGGQGSGAYNNWDVNIFTPMGATGETGATGATGMTAIGGAFIHTQTTPSVTWTINHNLNSQYVNVEPVDDTGYSYVGRYDYPFVYFNNANTVTLQFTSAVSGHAAVTSGGGPAGPTGATGPVGATGPSGGPTGATGPSGQVYLHTQSSPSTTWTVVHNLNNQYVNVEPVDSTGNSFVGRYNYPVINFTNANALTMTFSSAQTGYAAVSAGGPQGATGPAGAGGTALNVLYVSKSGNDANSGDSLGNAKLTIAAACAVATAGTTIFVKSGDYTEVNPINVPAGVAIVGDNLRTTTVRPSNRTQDLFWLKNNCYITGFTFRSHLYPAAAIAFPTSGGGTITTSPYVQNCSSIATSIKQLVVAGSFVTGYTYKIQTVGTTDFTLIGASSNTVGVEFTATGPGTGDGTAYLVVGCGMRIDGSLVGGLKSMVMDSYTQFNQGGMGIHILNQGYAQLVSVFTICCSVGVKCESGGSCSLANSNNAFGDFGLWADGIGPVLYSGTLVSYTSSSMTIGGLSRRPAVNDGFLVNGGTDYLLVREATPLIAGVSTVTFAETLTYTPVLGNTVDFRQLSIITASNQTMEYVGTGTDILTSTPRLGGVPIQANEIVQTNNGRVNYTSTDQFGDFRIGEGLLINAQAGVIEGTTFDKSLFAVMTPYILALEG